MAHMESRVQILKNWFTENHNWLSTAFSDEKRFNLDGPDNLCTHMSENDNDFREKRQCKGGSVMVWLMAMPNGLLIHKFITGIFKSVNYA